MDEIGNEEITENPQPEAVEEKTGIELAEEKKLQIQREREDAKEFLVELKRLKSSEALFNQQRVDTVSSLLDHHEGASSKGLLELLLKMKDPQNTQLSQNIDKIEAAILAKNRSAGKLELEVRAIYKEIDDQRFDSQAKAAFECLEQFLRKYRYVEGLFDELKQKVFECEDARFFLRSEALGFEKSLEICFDSFLQRDVLQSLSIPNFVERVGNLGTAYGGEALLSKDSTRINVTRHIQHDGSVVPAWMEQSE